MGSSPGRRHCAHSRYQAAHLPEENVAAAAVMMTQADPDQIDTALPPGIAAGDRYSDMSTVNR